VRVYVVSITRPRPGATEEPYDWTDRYYLGSEELQRRFHSRLREMVKGQEDVSVSGWIGSHAVITDETFDAALQDAAAIPVN
jgi:hypothetical protein